jgi:hypothetical protein
MDSFLPVSSYGYVTICLPVHLLAGRWVVCSVAENVDAWVGLSEVHVDTVSISLGSMQVRGKCAFSFLRNHEGAFVYDQRAC